MERKETQRQVSSKRFSNSSRRLKDISTDILYALELFTFSLAMVNWFHCLEGSLTHLKEVQKPNLVPYLIQILVQMVMQKAKRQLAVVDVLADHLHLCVYFFLSFLLDWMLCRIWSQMLFLLDYDVQNKHKEVK